MEVLALIPARGGSKGIPGKNIKLVGGYPLIQYSVAAAQQSRLVTRIVCTTDDDDIASVARDCGCEIPFMRPAELAGDHATDVEAFVHALEWFRENEGYSPDAVVHLRPTAPIRQWGFIDNSVESFLEAGVDAARSVVDAHPTPFKMWTIENGHLAPFASVPGIEEPYNAPRQILPTVYSQSANVDIVAPNTILKLGSMTGQTILPLVHERFFAVDVDTPEDLLFVEAALSAGRDDVVLPS